MIQTDWERYRLKGRVKMLLSEKFAVSYETGQVISDYSHRKRVCFNEHGMVTELQEINTYGIKITNFIYRYDEKQKLTESVFVNPDGSFGTRYIKKYDEKDRLSEEQQINDVGTITEKIIHTYDTDGLHAFKRYDIDCKCCSHILEWRNPETNIVESHWYNAQDKLEEISWNNPLDDHGSFECLTFDGCRNFKRKSVFIMDVHGHRIEFHEESASSVDRPIHSYYKNEYDERGNIIVHTCRDQDGHLHFRHIYHYYETGNVIETKVYGRLDNSPPDEMYQDHLDVITLKYYGTSPK